MMPELCANNLGTMSTQEEVGLCIGKRIGGVTRRQILPVWQYFRKKYTAFEPAIFFVFIHLEGVFA